MQRTAIVATVLLAVSGIGASAAHAEGGWVGQPKPSGEIVDSTPSVVVALDGGGRQVAKRTFHSGGAGPAWTCVYYAVVAVRGSALETGVDRAKGPITPEVDKLVALTCFEGTSQVHQEIFTFDPVQPFGNLTIAEDAALLAREMLPLPDPEVITSPPAGRPQLTGIATWYRVSSDWQPASATATLGGVSATVTATPTKVDWDPGDGTGTITCNGPGTAYDPAHPDATSDCTHTYIQRTRDGQSYPLTATITYTVAWTATDGSADTLDPVTRTTTVPITVAEAQALVR